MIYKGYAARIEYSDEDESFIGRIAGIQDVVGFHGDSVTLKAAFEEAVDDYLEACAVGGARRNRFRKFMVRVT
jgi:predicted HicB family RNase H-like nuclease